MTLRNYKSSSSFKMAALFTVLLGIAFVLLITLIYLNHNVLLENTGIFVTLIICMVMMLLVIGVSYFISVYVVSRINHIASIATNIMDTGDLTKRIDVSAKWDDLSALAYILNDLFAKVDELMIGIRQVSDNIAHDLRTPLTRIRNHLDTLKNDINKENQAEVNSILEEADRLLDTFRALLRISNIEKGKNIIEAEEVYINELIDDVAGLYEPLLEEKQIQLTVKSEKMMHKLDKNLMFQALANILDNAMKFTPNNGSIIFSAISRGSSSIIEISDTGKGIPIANKQKVFDRFYREDKSRSSPGNGLGLSLVKAIISLHKGQIELLDNIPCGLKIRITLPNRVS